ncbi:MAG TPA: 1-acyl-sn-glycerol-3-phosphate acyltransferase [Chlamydiales bacterium]|jgi:glycerol-3-phosphate O-acyltransferase|nr:1-acyl-sn-glycerol-3-phosphate acyltransferase [Chlamydiales bacterium]
MDKKSTPEELLAEELHKLQNDGAFSEKYCQIVLDFIHCYAKALEGSSQSLASMIPIFQLFIRFVLEQLRSPYSFEPYHRKVRHPIDYYRFSLDFIRPLIDLPHSKVFGLEFIDLATQQIARGENVVFLANHQTEADPQAIAILLEQTHPKLAEQIIYVAGARVITDPLAIPFSLGCDLLCIYSKRYIDQPPELKAKKQLHNKNTMELMSRLLQEGGKAIYVAPSGGRDRKDGKGHIIPDSFDPNSVEMFYLMAKKAKTPTHFYPLALDTYDLLPPPEIIQVELGEVRTAKRTSIRLAFGPECDMESYTGETKEARRKAKAEGIWKIVCQLYSKIRHP